MSRALWCIIPVSLLVAGCSVQHDTGANPPVNIYLLGSPLRQPFSHAFTVVVDRVPAVRSLGAAPDPTQRSLEALFAYRPKTAHGWGKHVQTFTSVPRHTKLLSLGASDHLVTVNVSKAFLDIGSVEKSYDYVADMRGKCALIALAQVVYTATEQDPRAAVQVLVEGQKVALLGDRSVDKPLCRRDVGRKVPEGVPEPSTRSDEPISSLVLVDAPSPSSADPGSMPSAASRR